MERVSASIRGQKRDRCAVGPLLSLYGARLTGCVLEKYYTQANAYALGQAMVRELCRPDILFGPFALALEGAAFGSKIQWMEKCPPNIKRPVLASVHEWKNLKIPDPDSDPILQYGYQSVQKMRAMHGQEIAIAAIALNVIDLPVMLLGIHEWLEAVLFYEEEANQLMQKLLPYTRLRINKYFESGADAVIMPCAFANPSILTRELVIRVSLPVMEESLQALNGILILHSAGAPMLPFIDLYRNLPNVAGFVLNSGEDMAEARKRAGTEKLLIGNIEGPLLQYQTEALIAGECTKLLSLAEADSRMILGTAGADIGYETSLDKIQLLHQCCQSFSQDQA